ncbi:MAG: hypothetical protein M1837_001755 [Sclerophora amabilis]|nr:MAG: hypothetical protein M1837_001755 [Sclerophora amabilis]
MDETTPLLEAGLRTQSTPGPRLPCHGYEVAIGEDDEPLEEPPLRTRASTIILDLKPDLGTCSRMAKSGTGAVVRTASISSGETTSSGSILDTASTAQLIEYDAENKPDRFLGGISPKRFWLLFSAMLLNLFVASFDSTLMASSHPVITSYFQASNSASWLSTAFLLTLTAFQPLFGRVSDTFGRKPLYIITLSIFVLSTVWCAIARSMMSFILARAASGLGAGGAMAMGSFICNDLLPLEIRGVYQSYINLAYGFGAALGAAFGGFLCDLIGWRWAFGIQVPVVLVCLVAAFLTTPSNLGPMLITTSSKSTWETVKSFDFIGSLLLSISATFLVLGLNLGGNLLPWTHAFIKLCFVIFGLSSTSLVLVELKAERPILPISLLTNKPRANLIFCNFCSAVSVSTVIFNIPLYFQAVQLESPTSSGLRLVFPTAAASIAAVSAGFIITWSARLKPTLLLGSVLVLLGCICLSCLHRHRPGWMALLFVVPAVVGQGFVFPSTVMGILATSSQEEQAVVSSVLMLWRSLGTVVGVAVSSLVLQNALEVCLQRMVTGPDSEEVMPVEIRTGGFLTHAIFAGDPPSSKFRPCHIVSLPATARSRSALNPNAF